MNAGDQDSGISPGKITITNEDGQRAITGKGSEETLANLNRDTTNTQNTLKPIFNEEEIKTRFQVTKSFTTEAGTYIQNKAKELGQKEEALDQLLKTGEDPNSECIQTLKMKSMI